MLIKSLKLNNIRSYLNNEINFPEGSTLLSGDIGSGKSTILLALEFALFGVKRKDLSSTALLRHGKKEGSVELKFNVDNKDIIVKRNLKRGKEEIKQEAGYVIIDGLKKEGTAVELKAIVLDLLGYPKGLVSKSKDLIYRYTVYTPQEEMKRILTEDKDIRLDILRRVFNIDKYKRIKENSQILLKEMKEKRISYEAQIKDIGIKQKQKNEKQDELKNADERLKDIIPRLKEVTKKLKIEKDNLEKIEKKIRESEKLKHELKINEVNLKNKVEEVNKNRLRLDSLKKQIEELKKELETKEKIGIEELIKRIKEKDDEIKLMEDTVRHISKKLHEFLAQKNYSLGIKEKITKLDKCPVCQQDVSQEHKESIHKKEDEALAKLEKELLLYKNQEKEAEAKLKELKELLNQLKEKERTISIFKVKKQNLDEKTKEIEELENQEKKSKKEIGKININKVELNNKIKEYENIDSEYKKIKKNLDAVLSEERRLELQKTSCEKEKEGIMNIITSLDKEIREKLEIKERLTYLSQMQNWFEEHFIKLMTTM